MQNVRKSDRQECQANHTDAIVSPQESRNTILQSTSNTKIMRMPTGANIHAPAHAFRTNEMHIAAASLRRISILGALIPPVLAGWLAHNAGIAMIYAVYIGAGALIAVLPLAWLIRVAADSVQSNAHQAEHEHETGVAVTPLNCRG
jgi:hypothetical protein